MSVWSRCWKIWRTSGRSRIGPARQRCALRSMSYDLQFLPSALKEWRKLDAFNRDLLRKKLAERLISPRVPADALHGMKDCYKIKLRSVGLRLIYCVDDPGVTGAVVATGRRDGADVYGAATRRLEEG